MKKKRVAIFAEKLYGGGVEKILQIICRNFDYDKYELTLYSSRKENIPEGCYPAHLQIIHYFSDKEGLLAKIENKIKLLVYYHTKPEVFYRLFVRKKYDVGIAFIEGYATRILSGAPKGMKKFAWIHIELGTFHWTKVAYRSLAEEKECYSKIDKIACVSEVVRSQAAELFERDCDTIVIHNPIEVDEIIRLSQQELSDSYVRKSDILRIVALGTLNKRKSFDRLLKVAYKLFAEGKVFEMLILGDGEEREDLHKYIEDNGMEKYCRLVGFKNNPYPYIYSSDIYVCSSYAEGYNTAVSESIILGKAIVSTEVSGIREQLGDNSEYGIITENSEEGLLEGLREMLNRDNMEYYQQKSVSRRELFNLDSQMQNIYNLIES